MDNASSFPLEPPFPRSLAAGAEPSATGSSGGRDGGVRRIRDMRFAEVAYRGWHEASKWFERVASIEQPAHPEALLWKHGPELADPEAALRIVRDLAPRRFFAGTEQAAVRTALGDRIPDHCRDVVAGADEAIKRHFDLLGYRALRAGDPLDLEPVRPRRAPVIPRSRLDPLDAGGNSSTIVWELNRHQWLVRLAQARALTGDERYTEACIRAIDAWLDANPPDPGLNSTSSPEVAFQLMSWCWTLLLLRDSPALSGAWLTKLLGAVWLQATHVRRYLSYCCWPNTNLTGEALGLFYAATLFPEFRDAARWRDVAVRILVLESQAQICSDGVHFEQSTCYHRYSVETYLHFLLLAERSGLDVPAQVGERVQKMVEFLLAIRQPDRSIPAIGDSDGGSLLPLAPRTPGDCRGVFATAAAMFRRSDFAWAAEGLAPEVLWLAGSDGARAFDAVLPAPPVSAASRVFPSGGYAVMRSGWERDAHQMIVDIGPLGCPVSSGHGHADLLSMQCAIFGEPCLVDAGTCGDTADAQWRDFFRSTAAHSTVMVDGVSQAEPAGPFGWRQRPRARLREWHSTPDFDFLDAEHDGYRALPDPVVHRRRVIFVKPGYWILVDDLTGASRHQVDLAFQFGRMGVTLGTHPWARAETPGRRVLWISPFPSAPVQPVLKCGEFSPIRGWVSPEYGQRRPAPMLIYSFAVALPWRIVTLLLPDRQGLTSPPAVRALYDDAGLPTGFAFERPRRMVRFDDRAVLVERE